MYKVFFNDRLLIIADNSEEKFLNNDDAKVFLKDPGLLPDYARQFLGGHNELLIISGDKERLWHTFQQLFLSVPAAGGVVKSNDGYLFILRKGKWDLPKGKIDNGETPEEAAAREVKEETGLQQVKIIQPLPSTWHIYFSPFGPPGSMPVLKETKWFLMEAPARQMLLPEKGEGITETGWFKTSEILSILSNTYASLRELITGLR
jgi:ADP-ribose pyrophosphatase YjhB (NUDIX family)